VFACRQQSAQSLAQHRQLCTGWDVHGPPTYTALPPAQEQLLHLPRIVADPYSGEQLSLQNVGVFDLKICHIGFASNGGFKPLV
jgi:hypothetical protein